MTYPFQNLSLPLPLPPPYLFLSPSLAGGFNIGLWLPSMILNGRPLLHLGNYLTTPKTQDWLAQSCVLKKDSSLADINSELLFLPSVLLFYHKLNKHMVTCVHC
jgi:hypothetical protein